MEKSMRVRETGRIRIVGRISTLQFGEMVAKLDVELVV